MSCGPTAYTVSTRWIFCQQHYSRQHRATCKISGGHHGHHQRPGAWSSSCWHGALYFPCQPSIPWAWVSAMGTRSSAWRSSHCTPVLNSHESASSTRMKNSVLRTEPWCKPTRTPNSSLYWPLTRTRLRASEYMPWMARIAHSLTPRLLKVHRRTFLVTRSQAYSRSKKAKQSSFLVAMYFCCSWRTLKMTSVVPLSGTKPNCISSIVTISLI